MRLAFRQLCSVPQPLNCVTWSEELVGEIGLSKRRYGDRFIFLKSVYVSLPINDVTSNV